MAKRKSSRTLKASQVDCLGMGIIPLDLLFEVGRFPNPGEKIDGLSLTIQGGGPVPNTLIGLTKFGYKTQLIAAVGNDIFGKLSIEEIKKQKVDASQIIVKGNSSAVAGGFVEQGSGRRTLVLERRIFVESKDLNFSKFPKPKIVHLDGRDIEATVELAKWGKKVGAIVSFDIGSMRNDVSSAFSYVDHLVVADSYAFPFTKTSDSASAIKMLGEYGPSTIVVTEGIKGATGYEKGKFHKQPAYKVKTIDTTGAGDAFHAGYLYGLLKGYDLAERLKWGAAVAALKCTKAGARAGIPSLNEVKKFLKNPPEIYDMA